MGGLKQKDMIKNTYNRIKERYENVIALFRIGDAYKAYYEDAVTVSKILGTPLQHNEYEGEELDSTYFQHYKLDKYLPVLVRHGYRVAIAEEI